MAAKMVETTYLVEKNQQCIHDANKDAHHQHCFCHEKIVTHVDMHENFSKISFAIEDPVTNSGHSFVLTQNPYRCINESDKNGTSGLTMRLLNTLAHQFCTSYSERITIALK